MDDQLLQKILGSVRLEARIPMRVRVSKVIRDRETDSHTFEVEFGAELADIHKMLLSVVRKWKGGFEVGTRYVVERV